MHVISLISTKGGVGKTTIAANLGGFFADAGLRVLLLDLDTQPTLSSYFTLAHRAAGGSYELLALNERDPAKLVSRTAIHRLDIIVSNDEHRQLNTLLLHAADGRLRLRNLLSVFKPHYDLVLIDTQGARSVLLEMALLASDQAVSPVTPEILAARELQRGTLQLVKEISPYRHLGIQMPPVLLLINRLPAVSANAQLVQKTLRLMFRGHPDVLVLKQDVPAIEAFPRAATKGQPVHRTEHSRPSGRQTPAALEIIRRIAIELAPQWESQSTRVTGKGVSHDRKS
ncbi:chromosome partitioning protein [Pseudomonas abyssi]|uniref:Chromosome partitioning protein n=1 Tax=Pseudomonas abyssi TaxID=170540 RepID=A0A2A3MGB5_9PSED|nr:ParA family protein [Pseudomonas abyssi]PBK03685.1 chromosome partitioning protein [Pseudomonas abyssi]